jgi:hypothetical protein
LVLAVELAMDSILILAVELAMDSQYQLLHNIVMYQLHYTAITVLAYM